MLGKTTIALLTSLLASTCFAGFYAGISLGPEGASFTQKAHIILPGTVDVQDKQHFSGLGVFGSLFGGYTCNIGHFNWSLEANANISSLQHSLTNFEAVNHSFSKTTFSVTNSEGISLLPGYYLSETTLFYGRIGYANGRLKIRESDPTIQSTTKNRNGIRYGVGVRHALTSRFSLLMDYSQINYSSIEGTVFVPAANVTKSTKITPNTAQIGFGFMYSFDRPEKA